MPVVLRYKNMRFVFYSNDHLPIHIHAIYGKNGASCKVILETLEIQNNKGFSPKDLKIIQKVVARNAAIIEEAWNAWFN